MEPVFWFLLRRMLPKTKDLNTRERLLLFIASLWLARKSKIRALPFDVKMFKKEIVEV